MYMSSTQSTVVCPLPFGVSSDPMSTLFAGLDTPFSLLYYSYKSTIEEGVAMRR